MPVPGETMNADNDNPASFWAIVELFGHTRMAGLVSECSLGGCSFVRVEVPGVDDDAMPFTRLLGNQAIYAINPVSESDAREAAKHLRPEPIKPWELPWSRCKELHKNPVDQKSLPYSDFEDRVEPF